MRIALALVAVASLSSAAPAPAAPAVPAARPPCEGTAVDDGQRFLCTEDVSWFVASDRCAAAGMQLAVVRSDEAQLAIEALLTRAHANGSDAPWIGLHKRANALWWSDGRAATFTFFTPGEPNGGEMETCIHLNWPLGSGTWNDAHCEHAEPWSSFVCERPSKNR